MFLKTIISRSFLQLLGGGCFFAFLLSSCNTDKLPEPSSTVDCSTVNATYDGLIKPIVDNSCALSGCHVSGGGGPGIFTTFNGISNYFNENGVERYVIDLRNDPSLGMPPNNSNGPKDLTPEELDLFRCWIEAGYPEN